MPHIEHQYVACVLIGLNKSPELYIGRKYWLISETKEPNVTSQLPSQKE